MKKTIGTTLGLTAAACLCAIQSATGAIILEWDAAAWSGSGAWADSVSGESLAIGEGTPTRTVDSTSFSGTGQQVTAAVFDGSSGFVSDGSTAMDGLKEFTISALVRVGATPGAGANSNSWNYNMITGLELGGGGQGEFQFGFDGGGNLSAGVGFASAGDASFVGTAVPAGAWATVAMVVRRDPSGSDDTQFEFLTYLNGVALGTPVTTNYGGLGQVVASAFGVGYNVINNGDRRYFTGEIARLRFDDTALSAGALTSDATNHLGALQPVPEPSSLFLGLFGGACALLRRRRK